MDMDTLVSAGADLIEQMYGRYLLDPNSVDPSWHTLFEQTEVASPFDFEKNGSRDIRVYRLIEAYRTYGHLMAKINPLATESVSEPWQLNPEKLGFKPKELDEMFPTCGLLPDPEARLSDIVNVLKTIYCGPIGIEYMGLQHPELEMWLQQQIEPTRFQISLSIDQKKMILQHLNRSELFEVFLHTKYTGQKRFSLEGGETLIPIIAAIIETGTQLGLREFVLGMAHRGRLNVLSNILNKSYSDIFSEFEEGYIPISFEGSGDVKYHKGFSSVIMTESGQKVQVDLMPNPSHLEAVNPVVEGKVYAEQVLGNDTEKEKVVPILVHGDAAIAGQGIIYETLQMHDLKGYSTGGTIHLVINNQIGFTTLPEDGRSTQYCTDIARAFGAPVFHVNAENPEGCIYATNLAVALRQKFHCDVFIDINCFRKYGHNEADEPAFTQPQKYQLIRQKKPIRELYRDDLIQQGVLERQMAEALEAEFKAALQQELEGIKITKKQKAVKKKSSRAQDVFVPVQTASLQTVLQKVGQEICSVPEGFHLHRKLQRLIKDRLEMVEGKRPVDWGMGELLAYGTLLWEGHDVRLAGQDSCRGTFSHRHAMLMDQESGESYFPLKDLKKGQGRFDVFNSFLSEYAAMGFEVGYSLGNPQALVLWEAQFGDFCNGAQIIIDQFLSTSEQKWGQTCRLTLLLPHGYEGQGPEHSSARIERFLTLAGDDNMFIVNVTTPAQLFHLLRRQVLLSFSKPLILFTPKGLLRHPGCVSPLSDFTQGAFEEVLDDPEGPANAKRLVLCCGRVYYDLVAEREKVGAKDMAIVRVEQLYPLHRKKLANVLKKYSKVKSYFWVQEEPRNMGSWKFIRSRLNELLPKKEEVTYIGRERSASPAAGSLALHQQQYAAFMETLFGKRKK